MSDYKERFRRRFSYVGWIPEHRDNIFDFIEEVVAEARSKNLNLQALVGELQEQSRAEERQRLTSFIEDFQLLNPFKKEWSYGYNQALDDLLKTISSPSEGEELPTLHVEKDGKLYEWEPGIQEERATCSFGDCQSPNDQCVRSAQVGAQVSAQVNPEEIGHIPTKHPQEETECCEVCVAVEYDPKHPCNGDCPAKCHKPRTEETGGPLDLAFRGLHEAKEYRRNNPIPEETESKCNETAHSFEDGSTVCDCRKKIRLEETEKEGASFSGQIAATQIHLREAIDALNEIHPESPTPQSREQGGEKEIAERYANELLDTPYIDPDSNECILARQFLRLYEGYKGGKREKTNQ